MQSSTPPTTLPNVPESEADAPKKRTSYELQDSELDTNNSFIIRSQLIHKKLNPRAN